MALNGQNIGQGNSHTDAMDEQCYQNNIPPPSAGDENWTWTCGPSSFITLQFPQ